VQRKGVGRNTEKMCLAGSWPAFLQLRKEDDRVCQNSNSIDVQNRPLPMENIAYATWLVECNDLVTSSLDLEAIKCGKDYDDTRSALEDTGRWPECNGSA
jgi:hypothetical protein